MKQQLTYNEWVAEKKEKDSAFGFYTEEDLHKFYENYLEETENSIDELSYKDWLQKNCFEDINFESGKSNFQLTQLYLSYLSKNEKKAKPKKVVEEALIKLWLDFISLRTVELAKLTMRTIESADLKDITDALPLLHNNVLKYKAVDELIDDLKIKFAEAIKEAANTQASKQDIKIVYSDIQVSKKLRDLVETCAEIGKPLVFKKLGFEVESNFDGVNKTKLTKTKKWKE